MDQIDKQRVSDMAARLELTIAWHDLDALLYSGIMPSENAKTGVWSSRFWITPSNVERRISTGAHMALQTANEGQSRVASRNTVQRAKDIVRNIMAVYHPMVHA